MTAEKVAAGPPSLLGQKLGPYQIQGLLGAGGMGEVHKARDTRLNRTVAIKAIPQSLSERADLRQRFAQEAKENSALNHPNIVTIHDILNDDGREFIVMEYVAGQTLADILARRKVALDDAFKYAIQIASALAAAHGAAVIHRDLKPGNIMVDGQGTVKVLDFGLAKLTVRKVFGELSDAPATKTDTAMGTEEGAILGTVTYMSPEQAEGKPLDARSDIFSYGTLLYELLTGQRPFQADSQLATLTAIIRDNPRPPSELVRGASKEFDRILERCLRKDRERRFQSAADLKVVLLDLQEELRNEKPAPGESPTRLWLWAGAMLLAAVGLALWFVRAPKSGTESSLRVVPLTSYPGRERYPSFSPDGKQVVFSWDGENQDNEDIYVKQVGTESRRQLTTHPAEDFSPTWSPNGNWIAFLRRASGGKATLILISPLGGRERPLGEFQHPWVELWSVALSWSPDNHWVAVPDQPAKEVQGIFLVSVETGERRRLTSTPAFYQGDYNPVFSPDGQTLAFARFVSGLSDLYLLPLSKELSIIGEPTRLTFENRRSFSAAWTPDGSELVFVSGGRHHPSLWRVPVSGRTRPQHLELGGGGIYLYSPTLSRQGDLVFTQRVSDVNIWRTLISGPDRKAGTSTPLISSSFLDHLPQFSPDGRKIACLSYRSGNAEIWVCDSDGSNAYQLTSFEGPECDGPRWSPDSQQIAFSANQEGQSEIYSIGAEGGKPRRLTIHPANDGAPSWSQDGKWILFHSTRTGEPQVWKIPAEGGEAAQVTKHGGAYAIESPDGTCIYFLKGRDDLSSLWKILPDGTESQLLDSVYAINYAVVKDGIYFIPAPRDRQFGIHFLSFSSGKTNQLASISKEVQYGFSVSPDERWILYPQMDHRYSDLMLVKNFR